MTLNGGGVDLHGFNTAVGGLSGSGGTLGSSGSSATLTVLTGATAETYSGAAGASRRLFPSLLDSRRRGGILVCGQPIPPPCGPFRGAQRVPDDALEPCGAGG